VILGEKVQHLPAIKQERLSALFVSFLEKNKIGEFLFYSFSKRRFLIFKS